VDNTVVVEVLVVGVVVLTGSLLMGVLSMEVTLLTVSLAVAANAALDLLLPPRNNKSDSFLASTTTATEFKDPRMAITTAADGRIYNFILCLSWCVLSNGKEGRSSMNFSFMRPIRHD
jgi:hypothetical protein